MISEIVGNPVFARIEAGRLELEIRFAAIEAERTAVRAMLA